ncbi:hypothetical protein Patl1_29720 [Pistacia atlantica]|uniref:Uncharacterized protein n=1 Tax=Pistacia atlantica TaxID=434234 RepID=A0ACC1AC24_9ROSI|nr:hypothetical protein Patl1_29720 [Pistacia atlantica]
MCWREEPVHIERVCRTKRNLFQLQERPGMFYFLFFG